MRSGGTPHVPASRRLPLAVLSLIAVLTPGAGLFTSGEAAAQVTRLMKRLRPIQRLRLNPKAGFTGPFTVRTKSCCALKPLSLEVWGLEFGRRFMQDP